MKEINGSKNRAEAESISDTEVKLLLTTTARN